ncbi:MAG: bifunctional nuclease family protein [Myxococcales bacterium]|nr:bifunctional nuclease family protein [Myxococcales bacterium]
MKIVSLLVDPNSGLPIVVLLEREGDRAMPIVIGMPEAEAIAAALQNKGSSRPRTHDLLADTLTKMGGSVQKVVVTDLRDSTFFAEIHVVRTGGLPVLKLDARPSDALALAVRLGAEIYVRENVLAAAHIRPRSKEQGAQEVREEDALRPLLLDEDATKEDLAEILRNLDPEDFGKYKM